jgi:curved DNA-binding protein CbpA
MPKHPKVSKNYYQILQVSPEADPATLKAAYRNLCKQYHPDLNAGSAAEEQMKLLNEAYAVVSDPVRRKDYDAQHLNHSSTNNSSNTSSEKTSTSRTSKTTSSTTAASTRSTRPKQRKDWLEDDYAYPRPDSNYTSTVQASARDFSEGNPRARDYKFKSVTALGRQLEQAILTYGPLDAWWLARHVTNTHSVGLVSKSEVSAALQSGQGRIFRIAWTDGGKPIWDLVL